MNHYRRRLVASLATLAAAPSVVGASVAWTRAGGMSVLALLDSSIELSSGDVPSASAGEQLFKPILAHVVQFRGQRVLVGTGAGGLGGATTPQLIPQLARAGLRPADIDVVLLTHLHPEHVGGMVHPGGGAVFTNAKVVCCRTEWRWWNESDNPPGLPARYRPFVGTARSATRAYADRVIFFSGTAEVVPGIVGTPALGHTAGHSVFRFVDGSASLLAMGDLVHLDPLQTVRPLLQTRLDTDPLLAAQTRQQFLQQAASERDYVIGSHVDRVSVGRVERLRDGFNFVPA